MTVRNALDEDLPFVYDTLKRIARSHLRGERAGHTLNTTALVHEAYLRLAGIDSVDWTDRSRFLGMASRAMRRVLIDHARARSRLKRSSPQLPVDAADGDLPAESVEDLLALDAALDRLEALEPRQCRVVECRFFAGMTHEETAEALAVSLASVKRDWTIARAFLNAELTAAGDMPAENGG
jgi:RNA polymerase sigma factor (TIGR02999 family)